MHYFAKILVVHANPHLWEEACGWLTEAKYTVIQATNGRSALCIFSQERPQIIIIDHDLPEGSRQLCQQLKNEPPATAPLIILGLQQIENLIETEILDDYLLLPLTKRELLLKVKLVNRLVWAECEREQLLKVAASLHNLSDNSPLLPEILSQLQTLFYTDSIGLATLDKSTGEPIINDAYGRLAYLSGKRIRNSAAWLEIAMENQEPMIIEDVQAWQAEFGIQINDSSLEGTQSLVIVPLKNQANIFGILWLGSAHTVTPSLARFLSAIGALLTAAFQQELWMLEIQQLNVDLEKRVLERTEELSVAYGRLQDLNQMKSNFVANVSHELRLPINNLMLYLNLLHKGSTEKRAAYETQLALNVERLNSLVDNILNLSRLEAQMDETPMLPVDFNDIVGEVVSMTSIEIEAKPVRLMFSPDKELPLVKGRRERLTQVVTNLVNNAVKHTDTGEIRIQTIWQNKQSFICFTVEDSGIGILPEDIPNIFNRFYRGRQSVRNQVPGSGLGLSIVREIVEQHNGRISVKSVPGQGSTFTICLPAVNL